MRDDADKIRSLKKEAVHGTRRAWEFGYGRARIAGGG